MSARSEPVPFEVYEPRVCLHGTEADLAVGEMLEPGRESNFEGGRMMNYIYFTATLDAAVWGAELAAGESTGSAEPTETRAADDRRRSARGPTHRR
jgi:rifampin ADP-ribosylating transferase